MRIYITRLKCLIRKKGNMFWTFLFPICLGTFFYLGFGNLSTDNIISTTQAYVASDGIDQDMITQMESVMIKGDEPLFEVNTKYTKAELEEDLINKEIKGYIFVEEGVVTYRINENGLEQTITKSFLDQYIQIRSLILSVKNTDPTKELAVKSDLENQESYLKDAMSGTNPKANNIIIYFYALIAMACMFASYWGIGLVSDIQADQSPLAARVNVTPTHKLKLIVIYALAALTLHFIGNLVLIAYLHFVLNIEFSNHVGLIILASFIGTISGIALGALLATLIKGNYNKKEGIISGISLFLSFLSGLMVVNVKYLITKNFPIAGYLNPANLLTESFYSLYYYSDLNKYFMNLLILFLLSLVMILGTYMRIRGDKYDGI